ncbi:MAG: hypothetical protein AB7P24_02580 [Nitrospira sp.]
MNTMSAPFSKAVFWIVLAIGMLPAILLVVSSYRTSGIQDEYEAGVGPKGIEVSEEENILYTHHAALQIGPINLEFFPRFWVAIMCTIGLALFFVGLVILLHIET